MDSRGKPTIEMQIVDKKLRIGKAIRKEEGKVVREVDIALHRLLSGEVVYVFQVAALVKLLKNTLSMAGIEVE
jgi:hypothetical protein